MDSNDKVYGVLAYIGILFLVPLCAGKTEFSRYHANQGLLLFILNIVIGILMSVCGALSAIPLIGFIFGIVSGLLGLVTLALMIVGIINAAQGEMKPLPVIGGIQILK